MVEMMTLPFDAQRDALVRGGVADTVALDAARPVTAAPRSVLVPSRTLLPVAEAAARVERRGRQVVLGHLEYDELADFVPIDAVTLPDAPAYLVLDVDLGAASRNVRPEDALRDILAAGRSPLTLDEGIALVLQQPEAIATNWGFSMAGSRRGDQRVPAFWISEGGQLGWCWDANRTRGRHRVVWGGVPRRRASPAAAPGSRAALSFRVDDRRARRDAAIGCGHARRRRECALRSVDQGGSRPFSTTRTSRRRPGRTGLASVPRRAWSAAGFRSRDQRDRQGHADAGRGQRGPTAYGRDTTMAPCSCGSARTRRARRGRGRPGRGAGAEQGRTELRRRRCSSARDATGEFSVRLAVDSDRLDPVPTGLHRDPGGRRHHHAHPIC